MIYVFSHVSLAVFSLCVLETDKWCCRMQVPEEQAFARVYYECLCAVLRSGMSAIIFLQQQLCVCVRACVRACLCAMGMQGHSGFIKLIRNFSSMLQLRGVRLAYLPL